jgi:hypothetical protein
MLMRALEADAGIKGSAFSLAAHKRMGLKSYSRLTAFLIKSFLIT